MKMITTNDKQRHVFDIAHKGFRDYIKKSELKGIKQGNIILYFLISLTYVQREKSRKNQGFC